MNDDFEPVVDLVISQPWAGVDFAVLEAFGGVVREQLYDSTVGVARGSVDVPVFSRVKVLAMSKVKLALARHIE